LGEGRALLGGARTEFIRKAVKNEMNSPLKLSRPGLGKELIGRAVGQKEGQEEGGTKSLQENRVVKRQVQKWVTESNREKKREQA